MRSLSLILEDCFSRRRMLSILFILSLGNFLFRLVYELHLHSVPYFFDQIGVDTQAAQWYTYMIPSMAKAWGGTWSSLGIGLLPIFHNTLGNTATYLLLNQLFLVIFFTLSWYAFGSNILTITVGLCAAFTTFNNHVYENGSLVIIYIPYIFCFLNLFAVLKLFSEETPAAGWWALWGASLILYIGSFEGWVDYYAITLVVSPACFYLLKKRGESIRLRRLTTILCTLTVAFFIFVYFKVKYVFASHIGEEHDLVINYGLQYWLLMVEDVIANFFMFFYMTIITYLPPQLTFSNSFLQYGPSTIIDLQKGYDSLHAPLAATNALLMWRYYAGVLISIFVYYLWGVSKKMFNDFNKDRFFLFIFMMMVLFGAAAHFLVKFRPMHIVPWLPYQGFIGQIGIVLLIGYLLSLLHRSAYSQKMVWSITLSVWSAIFLSGLLKAPFYKIGVAYGGM